jgi:hypothetical protein
VADSCWNTNVQQTVTSMPTEATRRAGAVPTHLDEEDRNGKTGTLGGCIVSVRVLFYCGRRKRHSSSNTVTYFCILNATPRALGGRFLLKFPSIIFILRPIWALIFARALRRDPSVSRTSTSYRSSNQPSSAQTSVLDLQRRLSLRVPHHHR